MPAVVLAAGIAVLSLWENPQVPHEWQIGDKLAHGLMYTVLAIAWMVPLVKGKSPVIQNEVHRAFAPQNHQSLIIRSMWVCVAVTAYGALMELLQHYCTVTRSGDVMDILADLIGAFIGVTAVTLIKIIK